MYSLSAHDILRVWEEGERQHPLDRALTMLAAASPGATRESLAGLPVGVRDRRLLALRSASFGSMMECFGECPACGERIEFTLNVADLTLPPGDAMREVEIGEKHYRVRVPDSRDMAAALSAGDARDARLLLLGRCVEGELEDMNEEIAALLMDEIAACDPQADPLLDLHCPACAHAWATMFDIASYLWGELCAHARRIFREVHLLARAHGWSEHDILSMTHARRQRYLEMVT